MTPELTSAGLARVREAANRHVGDDNVPGLGRQEAVFFARLGATRGGSPGCFG
jgi:hypothetical protein